MPLKTQLTDDMKQAMRDRDQLKLGAIRYLISEIRNYEIDHGEQDDAGVQVLIEKQVKQMKDAITEYGNGGRQDLVDEESKKVDVIMKYLPQQMSDEELTAVIKDVIASQEAPNMGTVMQAVKAQVSGQADGSRIAQMVKSQLS